VIDLAKNFGHHKAMMTGLTYARGELVFLIDSDLEEAPELLSEFWEEMRNSPEVDVVYGVQKSRKGGWFEKNIGGLYYLIFNVLSDQQLPKDVAIVRLMKRAYVQNVTRFQEADLVFAAVCAFAGYVQKPLEVSKGHKKSSTYTLA